MPTQRIAVRIPRNQTDPDAQAFITAAGITDTTQKSAINTLVVNLKAYGIWTKMKALYPMVGGTSTAHKFNLKDPRDLDVAFRLQFNGGWTHSANGALPNGTNAYADTSLNPSSTLTLNNTHLSFYSRTNVSATQRDIAIYQGGDNPTLAIGTNGGNEISDHYNYGQRISTSITSSTGFYIATRTTSTSHKLYKNNTTLGTNTSANVNSLPNGNLFIGASNNTTLGIISSYSTKQCTFASIGDGLTDVEAANFYTAVQAFQTTLGRSIGTQTVSDTDAQAFINAAVIDDQVQATAINNLVVGLKVDSIWTKMKALYPMVGGTASTHKFNLKDPRDLAAAYRLTFNGGFTHSANGALPNGTNAYANTNLNMSTALTNNNTHVSFYGRTNNASNDIGIFQGGDNPCVAIRTSTTNIRSDHNNYNNPINATVLASTGFEFSNRSSSTSHKLFINGNLAGTNTVANIQSLPNGNVYVCGVSQEPTQPAIPGNKQCAFASIGDSLTDAEAANFYTRVQAFQVALGREIIPNQTLNLDAGKISSYPGTGTIWTDLSNNSRTGTLTNGVGYSTLNNGSLTFNGSNQYVSVTNLGPVLNNVNKFTLNTWFKLNNPSLNNTIFSFGNNGYYNDDILLAVYGSTIFAQVNTGGDGSAYLVAPFTSTAWTNCQIVFDGTQTGNANRLKMYINGVLQTLTYSYTIPATTSNLNFTSAGIGAYSTGGFVNFMNGNVSLTELYNTALNQSEVTQNFNNIKSRYGL